MDIELLKILNEQLNKELYAAYLYLSMSAYFSELAMDGFAKNLRKQSEEELVHAGKIYDYLIERDENIVFKEIEAPNINWESPLEALKRALEHEKFVTESIEKVYEASKEKKDWATEVFLQWFIAEQVEEEEKFRTLIKKLENIQEFNCEINRIDRHLED